MSDLSDFIGENDIYEMKDKIVQLHNNKNDLEKQLAKTPKLDDKEKIINQLAPIYNEYHDIHPTFQKNYNNVKSMI